MTAKTKVAAPSQTGGSPQRADDEAMQQAVAEEEKEALEALEFLKAVDGFKRRTGKAFPTWTEILQIVKSLGYRKTEG